MDIGYGRVSTGDQNASAQIDGLRKFGCERIYVDKASGALASRPELERALDALRPGDRLVITKLDRLGRSLHNLISLSATLDERGVQLLVLDQGIDTSTPAGRMYFHMIGAIAEFERALISERTKDGLQAARARGRKGGRPPALSSSQRRLAQSLYDEVGQDGRRRYTAAHIAEELGVSRATLYRTLSKS